MGNNIEFSILGDIKDIDKKLSDVKKGFDNLGKNAGIALAGLTASAFGFIEASRQQEQAINQLNQALQNQGNFSESASKDLLKYASALQEVSLFGDENIIQAQALIASFGFEGQVLKDLTKATLDLAQAKGMDLASAADIVGKSVGSTTNVLGRYGIAIEGVAGSTERAKSATEGITRLYGGQAEAATKGLGATIVLKNAISDLAEDIGTALAPKVLEITKDIKLFIDQVKQHPEVAKLAADIIVLGIQVSALAVGISLIAKATFAWSAAMAVLNAGVSTFVTFGLFTNIGLLVKNVGLLYPLIVVTATAFASWNIGRLISEVTGLDKALQGLFERLILGNQIEKLEQQTRDSLAARGQTIEQIRDDAAERLKALQDNTQAVVDSENKKQDAVKSTSEFITDIEDQLRLISQANTQADLDNTLIKFEEERNALQQHLDLKLEILRNNGITEGEEYQKILDQKAEIEAKYNAAVEIGAQEHHKKISEFEKKGLEIYKKVNEDKLGSLTSTLQQAAQLNRDFATAYKVIAISQAVINTALGVTAALSRFDFISAGLIAAQGGVQIATIAAQEFAVGTPEVPQDQLAEIHKKEMIIPATFSEGIRQGDLTLSGRENNNRKESENNSEPSIYIDLTGSTFNGITPSLVEQIFTMASENIANKTLVFRGA